MAAAVAASWKLAPHPGGDVALLVEDQLVLARDAQAIASAIVFDPDDLVTLEDVFRGDGKRWEFPRLILQGFQGEVFT